MSSISIHETIEAVSPNPHQLTHGELVEGARAVRAYVLESDGADVRFAFSDPIYITHAHGRSIVDKYTFHVTRHWFMNGDFFIGGDAGEVFNVDKHYRRAIDTLHYVGRDDFDVEPEDDDDESNDNLT